MNILIIGGAGYIGSHVNKLLSQAGFKTIILDNLSRGFKRLVKWGEYIEGDFSDGKLLKFIFEEYKIDVVMHFSAYAYVGESTEKPIEYYNNNVINTIKLLNTMIENKIKYFIFSSSCATYGNASYLPIDEKHPQNPVNPYGRTKVIIENVVKDYEKAYGLRYCILRYFNAAGADPDSEIGEMHNPETHLIPLVLDSVTGKIFEISVFGDDYETKDGTCIRDYLHVNDIAKAHILSMQWILDTDKSNIFNLGNETGYSVMDVIKEIEKITGEKVPFVIKKRRDGDPPILIASSNKAHDVLKWHPDFNSLNIIIKTAWKWHLIK